MADDSYLTPEYLAAVGDASTNGAHATRTIALHREPELSTVERGLPSFVRAIDCPPAAPRQWLVKSLWPAAVFGLFVGDGGAFKSSLAIHCAGAIGGGYPVFEQFEVTQGPVCILSAEDDADLVVMRLRAFCQGHGWDTETVLNNVHVLACEEATLSDERWKRHLKAEILRIAPVFIVLDPWAELLGGDENSNTDARPVIKFVRTLARTVNAALAVVHHAGKMQDGKRQVDRIRGASALPSAARVILFCDYRPDGVAIENLKMTRSERLDPFVIHREITTDPANRQVWTSARLGYRNAKDEALEKTQLFVAGALLAWPYAMHEGRGPSVRQLRELGKGVEGVRNPSLDVALERLRIEGAVTFTMGRQKSHCWHITDEHHPIIRAARASRSTSSAFSVRGNDGSTETRAQHLDDRAQLNLGTVGTVSPDLVDP